MKDCFASLAMTGDCHGLRPRNDRGLLRCARNDSMSMGEKKPAEAGFKAKTTSERR
jgi:hypothetical protein